MSITGIYVECNRQAAAPSDCGEFVLTGQPAWVEHVGGDGTTQNAVPTLAGRVPYQPEVKFTLRITAFASAYVLVGPETYTPGLGNGVWMRAGDVLTYSAQPGDRVSWAATGEVLPPVFTIDAQGLYSERSAYDSEDPGFVYLSTNGDAGATTTLAMLFFRVGTVSGTWSDGVVFQGPAGAQGPAGPTGPQGPAGTNGTSAVYSDATPQALGTAAAGVAAAASRADHVHAMPTKSAIGLGNVDNLATSITTTGLTSVTVPAEVLEIWTCGYATAGDGGGAKLARDAAGTITSADGAKWRIASDVINPLMFGAKGDGVTDDAVVLQTAWNFAGANNVPCSMLGRVFRTTVGGFTLPDNVTIQMQGSSLLLDGNVSVGTFFFRTGANNNIDAITVNVASGRSLYRGVFISQGSRIGRVCVISASQQANTGNLAYGAVVIGGGDVIVGEVTVQNFDRALLLYSYGGLGVLSDASIASVRIKNYVCGIYIRNWRRVSISDYNITGRSPNALPDPGQNGVLIEGAEYVRLSNGLIADAGEHGFRSGGFRDSDAGTGSFVYETKQLTVDTLQIYGSGQSGFKIWASSTTKYHRDVSLSNIQVVDCGANGDALAFNDMGFMLQAIDGLTVSGCSVGKRALSYCAYDGFFLSGISRGIISGCRSFGASRNGLRISEFSDDASLDAMAINTLDISQFTADVQGAQGIYINFSGSSSIRDMMITAAHIVTCTNGVETNAVAARFSQPCYVSAFIRGASGSKFVVPATANLKTVDMSV